MASLLALLTTTLVLSPAVHGVPMAAEPAVVAAPRNIVRGRLPRRGYVSPAVQEHDSALAKRSAVPLIDNAPGGYDVEYLVNLAVGTPQQNFTCLFDTGSDILYVPAGCNSVDCEGHSEYSSSASSTFTNLGDTIRIEYGKGSASGIAVEDTVTIGNYTVQKQAFVAANVISDGNPTRFTQVIPTDPSDCLVGISYDVIPATGTLNQPNFIKNLVNQGKLSTNSFGMYLTRAGDVNGASSSGNSTTNLVSGSELCIDCVDNSKTNGNFATIPLMSPNYGYWAGKVDGVTINGQLQPNTAFNALFDSGTTFAGLPDGALALLANALGARQSTTVTQAAGGTGYSIACSNNLPASIGIQIAGVNFPFNSEDLVEQFTQTTCGLTVYGFGAADSSGLGGILGQTFLKSGAWLSLPGAEFNYNNGGSIGIAALGSGASSGASTTTSTTGKSAGVRSVGGAPSAALMALVGAAGLAMMA